MPPPAEPLPPAGLEQITPAGSTPPPPAEPVAPTGEIVNAAPQQPAGVEQINAPQEFSQAELDAIQQGQLDAANSGPSPYEPTASTGQTPLVQNTPTGPQTYADMPGQAEGTIPQGPREVGQGIPLQTPAEAAYNAPFEPISAPNAPTEPNAFMEGLKSVGDYASKHEFQTAGALYLGANALGMFKPTGAPPPPEKKKYANPNPLSANFKGGPYSQPNVYKPTYKTYASGGITQVNSGGVNFDDEPGTDDLNNSGSVMMASGGVARFANEGEVEEETRPTRRYRGDLMGTLDRYSGMITGNRGAAVPTRMPDVGIASDSDAETRYQDAYTAALTRLKKNNKRANVDVAALPTGIQAGALSLQAQKAAGGGIMQASLGSYASGGNPRLLKGPGDGMSDNIPATINGKQPARLADGEFVIPADVVSHLGNGSTEAGAKKLHQMMDKIRMDRTGKKKQAPAVKAGKYIPK